MNVDEFLPGHDIPIVATLDEALALPAAPDALLIGIAPTGGKLPPEWRTIIRAAIDAGLDVLSGLHTFLGDDPEFAAGGDRAWNDDRRLPASAGADGDGGRAPPRAGQARHPDRRRPTAPIGKMSVALELRKAAVAGGDSAVFVPTGQTGMMIEGWGVAVDRLISDFTQGTVEWLVEQGEELGDWVIVEGQGSLDHPAYSSVTLGLIHGATPHAMVMVHKPGLTEHDFDHLPDASFPIAPLPAFIALHEQVAGLVAPSRVVAVALNTSRYPDDDEARRVIADDRGRDRAAGRRPGPLRGGPTVGGGPRRAWTRCRGSPAREPAPEPRGPAPRVARPVPDRPDGPRHGRRRDDGRRRASRRPVPGASSGWGRAIPDRFYGETPETMAAVFPLLLDGDRCGRARTRPVWSRPTGPWTGRSAATAPRSARSTSPSTTSSARSLGVPVHELLGLSGGHPADRLHDRHRRAGRSSPSARRGRPTSRRSRSSAAARRTSPRCDAVREVFDGPIRVDANTGWTPRRRRAAPARARARSASS